MRCILTYTPMEGEIVCRMRRAAILYNKSWARSHLFTPFVLCISLSLFPSLPSILSHFLFPLCIPFTISRSIRSFSLSLLLDCLVLSCFTALSLPSSILNQWTGVPRHSFPFLLLLFPCISLAFPVNSCHFSWFVVFNSSEKFMKFYVYRILPILNGLRLKNALQALVST